MPETAGDMSGSQELECIDEYMIDDEAYDLDD